jgi:hypothetical protein
MILYSWHLLWHIRLKKMIKWNRYNKFFSHAVIVSFKCIDRIMSLRHYLLSLFFFFIIKSRTDLYSSLSLLFICFLAVKFKIRMTTEQLSTFIYTQMRVDSSTFNMHRGRWWTHSRRKKERKKMHIIIMISFRTL